MTSPSPSLAGRRVAVIGGGITGLASALVLSQRGARVTIIERDADDRTDSPDDAFVHWKRRGAPQVRHSHVFLGRVRNLLRDHYPEVLEALLAAGARELRMMERPPPPLVGMPRRPGDEDLVALGCRRITFEWVLRRHVLAQPGVSIISGVKADGLLAQAGDPPHATGVRFEIGEEKSAIEADLVVDASGRRSAAPQWLEAIGARPAHEQLEQSGIVYYTRFYRMRPGAAEPPPSEHPTAADFNWVKFAVFPCDNRVFSVTLAVPLVEERLKVLAQAPAFEAMVRSIPGLAPWIAEEIAEPIADQRHPVQAMSGLINRLRRFSDERSPLAIGLFVLGDAVYCTNPLYGRGCTQGFLHAHFLGESLDAHPRDLAAAALDLDRRARRELEPFYRASVIADRDAVRKAVGRRSKRLSNRLRQRFFDEGVALATRCDPVVYRAFIRMMNMLETPEEAFGHPGVVARSLWVLALQSHHRRKYGAPAPPDREATIARCEAAAGDRDAAVERTSKQAG